MRRCKKWKKAAIALLVAAVLPCLAAGIRQYKKYQPIEIIYIPKVYDEDNDFWMNIIRGARSAAKEFQAEFSVYAPEVESDFDAQITYIHKAIKEKPDVIAITPILYSEMTEEIEKITEAGISLILIDSKIDRKIETSYIGTDNINAGVALGEKMLQLTEADTKIAVMAHVKGASTAIERERGMRQGLGKEVNRIEAMMYCDSDYEKAYQLTKELFAKRTDINMVAGLNLYSIIGAARAVHELGLGKKVKVVGIDNSEEGIQYMEEGTIDALVVQKPFNMGYLGIEAAVRTARGEHVEKVIDSGMEVITVDNIYTDENEKLLFSF